MNVIKKTTIYLALLITTLLLVNCSKEESVTITETNSDLIKGDHSEGNVYFSLNSLPEGFVSSGNNPTKISYNITSSNPNCLTMAIGSDGGPIINGPTSGITYSIERTFFFYRVQCGNVIGPSNIALSISFVAKGVTYQGFISTIATAR
jgi:hypothetical protein